MSGQGYELGEDWPRFVEPEPESPGDIIRRALVELSELAMAPTLPARWRLMLGPITHRLRVLLAAMGQDRRR